MNPDFENQLQRQPMRAVPPHWRKRILAASAEPAPAGWRQWFWPCPQAWAALAAVWVLILGINVLNAGAPSVQFAFIGPRLSHEAVAEVRQEQEILARLIFSSSSVDAEPPKAALPRRSELRPTLLIV
jgi:hypothetical protein